MNGNGCTQTRFECALDPGVIQRGMFPREMDAAFRFDDLIMPQSLLTGIKEGERSARVGIVMPHMRGARLELLPDLRMDHRNIFNCLLDPFVRKEGTPALGILRPGVACQKDASPRFLAVIGVVQVADSEIGDSPTAIDAVIFLPEPAPRLEEDLGRGIVVQLTDGALLGA